VVLWSIANETPVSDERNGFLASLAATARELDPTRLITAALDTQTTEGDARLIADPLGDIVDVIGINSYCGWYSGTPESCAGLQWRSGFNKPVIMSEFGAGALAGLHGDAGQRWSEEYQAAVYANNIEMLRNMPFLRGAAPWILMDFRSPRRPLPGIQDFWNRKGLVSPQGERKQAFSLMQDYYSDVQQRWPDRP
jgi:beta-glucuronidase